MGKIRKRRRLSSVKEGSRAYRRALGNPRVGNNIMKGLREFVAMKAADRPSYVAAFFAEWENAVASVDAAAETTLGHPNAILTKEVWESLLAPYETFRLFYFTRLMDHLEPDEEGRFSELRSCLNGAWQKFFAATLVRHPALRETVDRIAENRRVAHDEVVDLFTGEAPPILTPRWARAMLALTDDFKPLAEGLRQ